MAETATNFEKMTPREIGGRFSQFFGKLGYNSRPEGHPITATKDSRQLAFVNCTLAPYIPEIEINKDNPSYKIHEAVVQKAVRLNSLDNDQLIANPQWMTSFDMAGAVTSTASMSDVTKQVNTFLSKEIGVDADKLHYIVNKRDINNHQGLIDAGVPVSHIHFQEENNKILVDWDYGVPGLAGTGITVCYVTDNAQLSNPDALADRQFLNIITIKDYNDGKEIAPLSTPFIDMGFGLERLSSLLKEKTPFELPGRKEVKEAAVLAAKTIMGIDDITDRRILTLTDHIITAKTLLDEGIIPIQRELSHRGPLLKRLIKNAILQAYLLNIDPSFITENLSDHASTVGKEVSDFMANVDRVKTNITDMRLRWLVKEGKQKDALRPRFSSIEMIQQFQEYIKNRHNVPTEITMQLLRQIDREAFYLSGFHERYYFYPTLDEEEAIASNNASGIIQLLKDRDAVKVGDIGAGKGKHSIALAKEGFEVTALDFDPKSIKALENKLYRAGITSVKPIIADGFQLEKVIQPGSLDAALIFYTSVLASGEREEDLSTLEQIKQTLKPGGVFMWNVTNLNGVKPVWMPGDADYYINDRNETILYTEKRDLNKGRINARSVAYRIAKPTNFAGTLNEKQLMELEQYRFTVVESESERRVIYKDKVADDELKTAQIVTSEEGLLSVKPYKQDEILNILTRMGFTHVEFHKQLSSEGFSQVSDGTEFNIVVTAINK